MGILSQLMSGQLQVGDIEVVPVTPKYPKGVQLSLDYINRHGEKDFETFYPYCELHDVYTDAQVEELRVKYFPKSSYLKWQHNQLIPVYKKSSINHIIASNPALEEYDFPLDYAEWDRVNSIFITGDSKDVYANINKYTKRRLAIQSKIRSTISALNNDNPMYRELLIVQELFSNPKDYLEKFEDLYELNLKNYLKAREAVIKKHSELEY